MNKNYLISLFKYSPVMCLVIVGYFCLHIFLNIKSGILVAPINHYGMYSGKMYIPDTINTTVVFINGVKMTPENCSLMEWDKILLFPSAYQSHRMTNEQVNETFTRILHFPKFNARDSLVVRDQFNSWLKGMLREMIDQEVESVTVYNVPCIWKNNSFKPLGKQSIIFQL